MMIKDLKHAIKLDFTSDNPNCYFKKFGRKLDFLKLSKCNKIFVTSKVDQASVFQTEIFRTTLYSESYRFRILSSPKIEPGF